MNHSSMKLGTKLGLAFSLLLALTLGIAGIALLRLNHINDATQDIAENWLPSIKVLGDIRTTLDRTRRGAADHLLSANEAERAPIETRIEDLKSTLAAKLKTYETLIASSEERAAYETFDKHKAAWLAIQPRLLEASRSGAQDQAKELYRGASRAAFNELATDIDKLVDINKKGSESAATAAVQAYSSAKWWLAGATGLAAVAAVLVSVLLVRSITVELGGEPREAADLVRRVADGDLGTPIHLREGDRVSLLAALKRMQDSLSAVVHNVRQNADSVATASGQISQGNSDLSSRTEEQASALQQTAASMKQLASTVKLNADNAQQGNELAQAASTVAARGGEVVGQVVETMKGINDSSRKIADIITVIDGIAFQTNILALNAAVEAARAGEQGRGFAVVASEVRSLAQRSAEAAKEIKGLITASVERVEQGSQLVDQAGTTMDEVVASIRRVTELMGEISAASREQSSGVAQIDDAVNQMDQATQQNAALVEESAAAADSLKTQAQQLVGAVSVFKLEDGHQASNAPALRAAPAATAPAARVVRPARPAGKPAARPTGKTASAPTAELPRRTGTDDDWQTF